MAQALNNETGTVNGEDDMSVYGGIKAVPVQRDNDDDAFLRGHHDDTLQHTLSNMTFNPT